MDGLIKGLINVALDAVGNDDDGDRHSGSQNLDERTRSSWAQVSTIIPLLSFLRCRLIPLTLYRWCPGRRIRVKKRTAAVDRVIIGISGGERFGFSACLCWLLCLECQCGFEFSGREKRANWGVGDRWFQTFQALPKGQFFIFLTLVLRFSVWIMLNHVSPFLDLLLPIDRNNGRRVLSFKNL